MTRIAVVMDAIETINYKKDSTLAMLWAAAARDCELYYLQPQDLFWQEGAAAARCWPLEVYHDPQRWFSLAAVTTRLLSEFDIILMRKDPPFDMDYIYATYLLEQAAEAGVLVVNQPRSLRDANEKLFATRFAAAIAPTLVTTQKQQILDFIETHGEAVIKPLDGMGGASIFKLTRGDPNCGVIIETLTRHGRQLAMVQRYLAAIVNGDKRILLINGKPVDYALARIPVGGELRGNLAAGGRGVAQPLTERDREICRMVAPELQRRGLIFVGIDVIGDHLTEVNVTSPTCIRELDAAFGLDIAGDLLDYLLAQRA
ncbi:MAG: glutathione synthase [Gammaproteobacteria bacterium]|nr:glutathione synthase [Gammaproteobacteria bacterium]